MRGLGSVKPRQFIGAGLYISVVAGLAIAAFFSPDEGFTWSREGLLFLLTLPALIVALPVVYLAGAAIWAVTDAHEGGPMWPVTLVFTLLFVAIGFANLLLVASCFRVLRRRRSSLM